MKVVVINSGSNGNSTYIETPEAKILIDCGVAYKNVRIRLYEQGIRTNDFDAIFITHDHTDHIGKIGPILKATSAVLYLEEVTYYEANERLNGLLERFYLAGRIKFIKTDHRYNINDVSVVPIELSHDTKRCCGYLVKQLNTQENLSFGTITDTGVIPEKYFKILSCIKLLLIESNHDVEMLKNCMRPPVIIRRILSDHGHLSNVQCAEYVKKFVSNENKMIILGHISHDCNRYSLAKETMIEMFGGEVPFKLEVATREREHDLIDVDSL